MYFVYKFTKYIIHIYFFIYGLTLGILAMQIPAFDAFMISTIGILEMFILWLSLRRGLIFTIFYVPLALVEYLIYSYIS